MNISFISVKGRLGMARLIDADALKEAALRNGLTVRLDRYTGRWPCLLVMDIANAPTIEAAPIVHGVWEKTSETMPIYRCSVCHERNLFKNGDNVFSNYCPNCGAKMNREAVAL